MRDVTLRTGSGDLVGVVAVPDNASGPLVIVCGDQVFVRQTFSVYAEATRFVVKPVN